MVWYKVALTTLCLITHSYSYISLLRCCLVPFGTRRLHLYLHITDILKSQCRLVPFDTRWLHLSLHIYSIYAYNHIIIDAFEGCVMNMAQGSIHFHGTCCLCVSCHWLLNDVIYYIVAGFATALQLHAIISIKTSISFNLMYSYPSLLCFVMFYSIVSSFFEICYSGWDLQKICQFWSFWS